MSAYELKTAKFDAITTATNVVAAVTGKKICVVAYKIVANAAATVKWRDGTTDLEGAQDLAINDVLTESIAPDAYLFKTSEGAALNLSTGASVSGRVTYYEKI